MPNLTELVNICRTTPFERDGEGAPGVRVERQEPPGPEIYLPVPVRATVAGAALDARCNAPVKVVRAVGANRTFTVQVLRGARAAVHV